MRRYKRTITVTVVPSEEQRDDDALVRIFVTALYRRAVLSRAEKVTTSSRLHLSSVPQHTRPSASDR